MAATERLYYKDSHLIEFEARVIDITERVSGWTAVTLDRTAFYPTGGGQPSDTGMLDGARVMECTDEGDLVFHLIQGPTPKIGATVKGRVDWPRRLDHIQQHSGQHILSQALVSLFDAPTRSFRVMEQVCEIDVDLINPTEERIERAVEMANNVIWEDRPMVTREVTSEAAALLPLRKEPAREGNLRLIEIEGFDLTPCGGTHASHTGEVGIIAVRSWERAKGLTRIEWVAGRRVLEDYRRANKSARTVAALFSTGRDEAPKLAGRMLEENKSLLHRLRPLEEIAARSEAEHLYAEASPNADGLRVVSKIFEHRDADSLRMIAQALTTNQNVIALLGSTDADAARLVFARSTDAPGDMNALMKTACNLIDGRGGGKPDLAQGGGKNVTKLTQALAEATQEISVGG
ncbi:MAG TPA: DHHA1 domain-containing protein [Pyrinomonadaceae bacterium]|nr:DHHA1 domain-containing protein [Pyrinomonadaceae bacterium]